MSLMTKYCFTRAMKSTRKRVGKVCISFAHGKQIDFKLLATNFKSAKV
ncbi:hypothetical protein [Campylobacter jejuni]|nr:hypothetical protein [Campylobacter jejuni]